MRISDWSSDVCSSDLSSVLEERESVSCLVKKPQPEQAPQATILNIGFQLPGFQGHFGVRPGRDVWIEDFHNIQRRATFSGLGGEKVEELAPQAQLCLNVLLPIAVGRAASRESVGHKE